MDVKKRTAVPENLDLFEKLMSVIPEIEIKGATMPYTSMNGNMYSFLKDGQVALRLPEKERQTFLKKFGSSVFEAYGAVMKEYVTITLPMLKRPKDLTGYVKASHAYAKTLKAKAAKKRS
jgi:hypothetical protein